MHIPGVVLPLHGALFVDELRSKSGWVCYKSGCLHSMKVDGSRQEWMTPLHKNGWVSSRMDDSTGYYEKIIHSFHKKPSADCMKTIM